MTSFVSREMVFADFAAADLQMDAFNQFWLSQQDVPILALVVYVVSTIVVILLFNVIVLSKDEERAVNFRVPWPDQCGAKWKGEILKQPSLKTSGSSALQCYCPANGQLLGRVNPATTNGIDRAIARAKEAQKEWAKTTFKQRRRVLRTLLKYILDNQDAIATIACLDSGKTRIDASFGEILVTVEKLKWTIDHGERSLRAEQRPTNFLMMYKHNEVRWEPLGVLAACVSWNYPFHNFLSPLISTLFTGSALVIKASENTAWSTFQYANIAKAAMQACGHSPDLIQPIVCWPSEADHLTSHSDISHITFIGSRPIAHKVAKSAAKHLTPVCLELGGKDPAIVLDDVKDLHKVASILLRGTFQSAGQNCIGIERIICLPGIYAELIDILTIRIRSLRVGSSLEDDEGVDVGAMINGDRFQHLENLISEAVSQGARCLAGGQRYEHPKHPEGHYFAATLVVDVTPSMRIAQEEVFAPICLLMRASSIDEAINSANSTPHALGASVFGNEKANLDRVVSEVHAGMISVNDFGVFYAVSLPFGGVKESGYGRFGGQEGLRGLCNTKALCRDRFPSLLSTSIPGALDYPIPDVARGWQMCKGVVQLGYAEGWRKAVGLWNVARSN